MQIKNITNVPSVSVCIPVRNGAGFIEQAVSSILEQSFQDIEVVIMDNCSTDGTIRIVKELTAITSKIKFYKHDQNIGLIENFNACLMKATGKYVKFLCADDVLMPDCIEVMVAALEAHSSATLATVGRLLINKNNKVLATKTFSKQEKLFNGKDVINHCLFGGNYIGEPSATMFRREILAAGFDVKFPHLVDLEMWFRLLEHGDLMCISKPLCAIRQHESQMTQRNVKSAILVEDNIRLFDMYKDKLYIRHNAIVKLSRKMRMAYRVWISRKYISPERKSQILRLHSSYSFYYLIMPIASFLLKLKRKLYYQFAAVFTEL